MANTIRIKRRLTGSAGAPASLVNAELAFNEVDGKLYYGQGGNSTAASTISSACSYTNSCITNYHASITRSNKA